MEREAVDARPRLRRQADAGHPTGAGGRRRPAHVQHIGTADLWAAGAKYRAELLADEKRLGISYGKAEEPWRWDESTYRTGL